jgi:DNA-binding response OmpR family regulator
MSSQPPPLPGKKILVVDDDAVIVRAISLKLKAKGFQVFSAADGSEAVTVVRKDRPDLIVLDITFPPDPGNVPWDGFRIMEWLHHMDESQRMPVIIITGGDTAKYKGRSDAIGATAFFKKPVNHDELIAVIEKTLLGK